jgi:hypothetical protein
MSPSESFLFSGSAQSRKELMVVMKLRQSISNKLSNLLGICRVMNRFGQ